MGAGGQGALATPSLHIMDLNNNYYNDYNFWTNSSSQSFTLKRTVRPNFCGGINHRFFFRMIVEISMLMVHGLDYNNKLLKKPNHTCIF